MEETKFCPNCGAEIDINAEICPKCGVRVMEAPKSAPRTEYVVRNEKNAGLAAVLSFFIPGLGQIYNGEIGKGLLLIILSFFAAILIIVLIGMIIYPLIWIYGIYDAYNTANKINSGVIIV